LNNSRGIRFIQSSKNTVINNSCLKNEFGITISTLTENNYLYHNKIIFNTEQAQDSGTNYWNNSQLEGNYWSDYNGLDNGNGTGIHEIGGDGIGDTDIPHLGIDYYPLMEPVSSVNPEIDTDKDKIPNFRDSDDDNDNMPDVWEQKYDLDPLDPDDAELDLDNDKLTNKEEYLNKTDPTKSDTDGDAFPDSEEIEKDTDPLDEDDYPDKKVELDIGQWLIYPLILIIVILILLILILNLIKKRNKD
jgi:parallel beta-helix repeat protein